MHALLRTGSCDFLYLPRKYSGNFARLRRSWPVRARWCSCAEMCTCLCEKCSYGCLDTCMYNFVCVCLCMCIHTHIYWYHVSASTHGWHGWRVHTWIDACMSMCTRVHVFMYVSIYVFLHVLYVCKLVRNYAYLHACMKLTIRTYDVYELHVSGSFHYLVKVCAWARTVTVSPQSAPPC